MNKRGIVAGICVVALLALGITAYVATGSGTAKQLAPDHWAQAKATKAVGACRQDNPHVSVSAAERSSIELSAVSYLIDVPAGTNVDVRLASHDATHVTGSDHYPAKYGDYNFAMTKDSEGWRVTTFQRCN